MNRARFPLLICPLLISACGSAPTEKLEPTTSATLRVIDIPGQDAACRNLIDVQFTIANRDISAEGLYPQRPRFDATVFESEDFKNFMAERREYHFRKEFTEQEREEVKRLEERYSVFLYIFDEESVDKNPDMPLLAKRLARFNSSIFRTIADEYWTQRVASTEVRRQRYLESLVASENTELLDDHKSYRTVNDELRKHYVRQRSAETCYAASLMTVWNYYGWSARYEDFVDQRVPHCELSLGRRNMASFNEIISTVFHLRANTGYPLFNWTGSTEDAHLLKKVRYTQTLSMGMLMESHSYAYINRPTLHTLLMGVAVYANPWALLLMNPAQQQLEQLQRDMSQQIVGSDGKPRSLYQQYGWHQTSNPSVQGYVMPLMHTGHMAATLIRGDVLLVGLKTPSGGHTVLVTGVEYEPKFEMQGDDAMYGPSTRIRRIRLLDPGPEVYPERWVADMDEFFSQYQFGIVIHQDRPASTIGASR